MPTLPPEIVTLLTALLGAFGGGLAAYVAIRSDLADHGARIKNLEDAAKAERSRMDVLLMADRRHP